jgi:hypothetical protein
MADHTPPEVLPPDQMEILRHALDVGPGDWEPGHRNHFATGNGNHNHRLCMALVERGLMTKHVAHVLAGGNDVFCVTCVGRMAATATPTKLTPAQCRYATYLREDSDFSFGDWLRRESRRHSLGPPRYA